MNIDLSNVPWWVTLIAILASCLGSLAVARSRASAAVQKTLVTQTVNRQQQLDERQDQIMDDLNDQIKLLRQDQLMLRQELIEERLSGKELRNMVRSLSEENEKLTVKVEELTEKNKQLTENMDILSEENKQLIKEMQILSQENMQLREKLEGTKCKSE